MTRDAGLEQMVGEDLAGLADITTTKMFGGFAWMWQGHLLCGARHDGILFRLGKGNDAWALALPDVGPMVMGGRPMQGWVRATGDAMGDDALRHRLIAAAQAFVTTLPAK
jgi:TfoX N-terminal domain